MPGTDQIDYAALAEQARAAVPPPAAPPVPAMNFAIINGQRVPVDDTADPMAPGVVTVIGRPGEVPPPAAPPVDYAKLAEQARQTNPAPLAEPSLWEKANTSPLHPYFEAARQSILEHEGHARGSDDPVSAMMRGAQAGITEGLLNVGESFTTPVGALLWLTGQGADSAAVKAIPQLKPLLALPAVKALKTAVHATAGAAFTAHGAGEAASGAGTIYEAATSPEAPPEGRGAKALAGLGEMGQGAVEMAGGVVGMHGAYQTAQPAITAWQQQRRTAAGAAALNDFRMAAPPSVSAPYTTDDLNRAFSLLLRDHALNAPITSVADGIAAADNQIRRLENGFDALIAVDPNQPITTKPLDAVRAQLGQSVRADQLDRGLAALKTLGLDQPLTVERANAIRKQLNAENDAVLASNKYDVAIARQVDPAFAAREAAAASLRTGIHDVLDARAQQTPGFTRDLRLDQGALIAVRNALLRQQYQNAATVGRSGVTSAPRRVAAKAVELGSTGAGAAVGAAVGGVPGAVTGSLIGKETGEAFGRTINKPPLKRDALIERAFGRSGTLPGTAIQTTPPAGAPAAVPQPGTAIQPTPPSGGPGGPGGTSGGPSASSSGGPAPTPVQVATQTFLALRARGYSREQAVQMAASFARGQTAAPPAPPPIVEGEIVPGPTLPPGPAEPRQLGPTTYADRIAAADPATIAADAAASPAVADQQAAAARAGIIAPDRGPQLPDAQAQRVLPPAVDTPGAPAGRPAAAQGVTPAVANFAKFTKDALRYAADNGTPEYAAGAKAEIARRKAAAQDRADARTATRAEAAAYEQQDIADLVAKAQANGYAGDPAALHAELADRLQGIKELHAEFDEQGTNGLTLLRAIAKNGGLSVTAAEAAGQGGELRWLKEFQDTQPSRSRTNLKPPPVAVSGQVRGVGGVFREGTQQTRGGRAGGQSLGGMLEALQADPRFAHLTTTNELSDAIRAAATGVEDSRHAIKDLAATSHDLIGTATIHPEDDLGFDPVALEAESQAHAAGARARQK